MRIGLLYALIISPLALLTEADSCSAGDHTRRQLKLIKTLPPSALLHLIPSRRNIQHPRAPSVRLHLQRLTWLRLEERNPPAPPSCSGERRQRFSTTWLDLTRLLCTWGSTKIYPPFLFAQAHSLSEKWRRKWNGGQGSGGIWAVSHDGTLRLSRGESRRVCRPSVTASSLSSPLSHCPLTHLLHSTAHNEYTTTNTSSVFSFFVCKDLNLHILLNETRQVKKEKEAIWAED